MSTRSSFVLSKPTTYLKDLVLLRKHLSELLLSSKGMTILFKSLSTGFQSPILTPAWMRMRLQSQKKAIGKIKVVIHSWKSNLRRWRRVSGLEGEMVAIESSIRMVEFAYRAMKKSGSPACLPQERTVVCSMTSNHSSLDPKLVSRSLDWRYLSALTVGKLVLTAWYSRHGIKDMAFTERYSIHGTGQGLDDPELKACFPMYYSISKDILDSVCTDSNYVP